MVGSPKYSAGNQANPPYYPSFQDQYSQISNGTFNCNNVTPSYLPTNLAYGNPILPLYQSWNQIANIPLLSDSQNEQIYSSQTAHNQKNTQIFQSPTYTSYLTNTSTRQTARPLECNDNKFDVNSTNSHPPPNHSINLYSGNESVNLTGGVHLNLKENESRRNLDTEYSEYMQRQLSDLYSPCITPIVGELKPDRGVHLVNLSTSKDDAQNKLDNTSAKELDENWFKTNGSQQLSEKTLSNAKSLAECRKKAQTAVLNLWPYGVRYETYLEEGFKKDFIDQLFKDLKIDHKDIPNVTHLNRKHLAIENPNFPTENHKEASPSQSHNESTLKAPSSLSAFSAVAKPSKMAEKEKTLQSKMEALRKSREARASARSGTKSIVDQNTEIKVQMNKIISTSTKKGQTIQILASSTEKSPEMSTNSVPTVSSSNIYTEVTTTTAPHPVPDLNSDVTLDNNSKKSEPNTTAPPAGNLPSETPAIPGLFLVSNTTSSTSKLTTESPVKLRKRPVASDFDDKSFKTVSFKRPFGHNRSEQRVVINVSDDESEDEDVSMELDQQMDQELSIMPSFKTSTSQSIPSASNSPGLKTFTPPPNSSIPSSFPLKQSLLAPSILKQKQREIQIMKQKIAAAEAQLKAKSTTGSTGTRQHSESSASDIKEKLDHDGISSTNSEAPETNAGSESSVLETSDNPGHDEVSPIDFKASETNDGSTYEDGDQSKSNILRPGVLTAHRSTQHEMNSVQEKILRRQKIADELPIIESEVQKSKSRLEQLKIEIARVEASLEKNIEERNKMTTEMKRLSQEQAYLSVSANTSTIETENLSDSKPTELQPEEESTQPSMPVENEAIILEKPLSPDETLRCPFAALEIQKISQETGPTIDIPDETDKSDFSGKISENNVETSNDTILRHHGDTLFENVADRKFEEALQEAVRIEADEERNSIRAQPMLERQCSPILSQQISMTSGGPMEEGELSHDYTPEIIGTILEGESDNYEPPDATIVERKSPLVSPPFSPAPPEPIELIKSKQKPPTCHKQLSKIGEHGNKIESPSNQNVGISQQKIDEPNITLHTSDRYTPYQSTLKKFRAYRFHPNFKNEIAGGLRSITYSHNIDPNKQFCRFEVAGGICNDSACSLQHFKAITLPDDGIMAALGCPDEFTGKSREKFVAGLREVLLNLRLRKINDFDIIASEIVAHRAKFLGDQSKILALEGVTI